MMKELRTLGFWQAVLAELIGTTMFVFCGISAEIGNGNRSYPDQEVKVALAFGLAFVILVQSLCHISGGHLNPAITFGMLVSCQISVCRALWYILAQMTGAVIASGIVLGVRPSVVDSLGLNKTLPILICWVKMSKPGVAVGVWLSATSLLCVQQILDYTPPAVPGFILKLNGVSLGQGFGIEFLITLQMVLCFLATMDKRRNNVVDSAPFAVGLSVVLGHLAGISYTGCGMNPARSFGPALVSLEFEHHWVFWAGPLGASVVAALLYDFVLSPRGPDVVGRLKILCHGTEALAVEAEPLPEGGDPGVQWEKP